MEGEREKEIQLIMFYAACVEMASSTFWRATSCTKNLPIHYFSIRRPAAESSKLSNSDNVILSKREGRPLRPDVYLKQNVVLSSISKKLKTRMKISCNAMPTMRRERVYRRQKVHIVAPTSVEA